MPVSKAKREEDLKGILPPTPKRRKLSAAEAAAASGWTFPIDSTSPPYAREVSPPETTTVNYESAEGSDMSILSTFSTFPTLFLTNLILLQMLTSTMHNTQVDAHPPPAEDVPKQISNDEWKSKTVCWYVVF